MERRTVHAPRRRSTTLPTLGVRPTPSTRIPVARRWRGGARDPPRRAARRRDLRQRPRREVRRAGALGARRVRAHRPRPVDVPVHPLLGPAARASREAALARYRDLLWAMQWKYSDMEASATRPLPAVDPAAVRGPDDALVKGRATYAGTPDELVEALLEIRAQAGVPVEFVAREPLPVPRVRGAGRPHGATRRGCRAPPLGDGQRASVPATGPPPVSRPCRSRTGGRRRRPGPGRM